ncbi:LysR family transcriptional regulator [Advenella mimigardefordensis]|uniref:Transcriptional regulator, LysR family n=1 Tax=Advenella mimigardefordensis (strain DSM 17166 / LMG 22922 / DPN7) TaxID=1247726 RepID=W0PJD0_ADVMD|nr:LysR family transcriptional regulator [Advenella mimigardefordensis]AHG65675.1 transcriptional regulator, LysR family [Advenella mimigardefordensis DPN7]
MARDIPPLNALLAFEAAARLLSVSKAGNELHVTHGAVSRQIRVLESALGVALIEKEGRGIKLTDSGVLLRDASAAAFDRVRSACTEIRRRSSNQPFVLACPGSLLARWFIPRLDKLNQDLPQLRLQLTAGEGELDPRNPNVDATLCFAAPPWPDDMLVHDLGAEYIGAVISPRCANYAGLVNAPVSALLREPLMYPASRPQAWAQWAQANQLPGNELQLGTAFEHLYYLLEAATAGLGVAVAPKQVVADDLAAGRLEAPWGFVPTSSRLSLLVPRTRADQRSVLLANWLEKELGVTQPH